MTDRSVQRTYLLLMLGNTLAASLIWGINTIFLLDAGLSNLEAFAANAFFTIGMVLFEVPTGIVADTTGRRMSYLLGTVTLAASTLLYVLLWQWGAPFWAWAGASLLLGLGFTFFSGATEAWLVDALHASDYTGDLETVFGRAQVVGGGAMLVGSVAGGVVAQLTDLGMPYIIRAALLGLTLVVAWRFMRDIGFTPERGASPVAAVRTVVSGAIDGGIRNRPVRWLMFAAPFVTGVGFYAFYALQPYLLELYGDPNAYSIAGLAAAILAGAQMAGGWSVRWARRLFARRTDAMLVLGFVGVVALALLGAMPFFVVAIVLLVVWALAAAIEEPIRRAYLNGLIPAQQRATVLSFDSLMGSAGGVVIQPALGRVADIGGYGASYLVAGVIQALSLPFMVLARREGAHSDPMRIEPDADVPGEDAPAP